MGVIYLLCRELSGKTTKNQFFYILMVCLLKSRVVFKRFVSHAVSLRLALLTQGVYIHHSQKPIFIMHSQQNSMIENSDEAINVPCNKSAYDLNKTTIKLHYISVIYLRYSILSSSFKKHNCLANIEQPTDFAFLKIMGNQAKPR